MKQGVLESYDSEQLFAADNAEAVRKATEWRVTAAATIDERTWLQVLLDGSAFRRAWHILKRRPAAER
jgi:hypothetical protein